MDTFEMCRLAADKARWSFDQELGDLQLNLEKRLLPDALCGKHLPHWISPEGRLKLNHKFESEISNNI